MESIVLEFEDVTGKSGKFRLSDISFALPAGYMMGLVGKNGAGKTTCLKYVMREKTLYTGSIRIDGKDRLERQAAFRNQVGFVSEDNVFFEERTGAQNVELLQNFYDHFDRALFSETMERLEVSSGKSYYKMSRGERMKFQMAFAMAHHPKLYLLDEVTAGMDPVFRVDFFKLLHGIIEKEEAAVLMTSHTQSEMKKQMDYIGILEQGKMTYFGENQDALWDA